MNENITQKVASNVFLATTSLTEYWDLNANEILFIGDWCHNFDNRHLLTNCKYKTFPNPWVSNEKLEDARIYTFTILYQKVMVSFIPFLNEIHGMNEGRRYWEIIIGEWLKNFLAIVYPHYMLLHDIFAEYSEIETYIMCKDDYIVPQNTMDFFEKAMVSDLYHLQLFSEIIADDFPNIRQRKLHILKDDSKENLFNATPKKLKHKALKSFYYFQSFLSKNTAKILLDNVYFHPLDQIKHYIKGAGNLTFNNISYEAPKCKADMNLRNQKSFSLSPVNEFELFLEKSLIRNIPAIFLEGFNDLRSFSSRVYNHGYKKIISSTSWYRKDVFNAFLAEQSSKGTKLICVQHGGGYGAVENIKYSHEFDIVDYFYSWGWSRKINNVSIIPANITKIPLILASRKKSGNKKILFVNTAILRHNFRLQKIDVHFDLYYSDQLLFVKNLNSNAKEHLTIRPYGNKNNAIDRYKEAFPNICIENFGLNFYKSLSETRLFIADHLICTTIMEALAMDIPIIIFWRPIFNDLTEEAKPIYQGLREVGIFHDSPEAAANYINEIHDNIETWWMEPNRQKAVKAFKDKFARLPKDRFKWWANEFKMMLKRD